MSAANSDRSITGLQWVVIFSITVLTACVLFLTYAVLTRLPASQAPSSVVEEPPQAEGARYNHRYKTNFITEWVNGTDGFPRYPQYKGYEEPINKDYRCSMVSFEVQVDEGWFEKFNGGVDYNRAEEASPPRDMGDLYLRIRGGNFILSDDESFKAPIFKIRGTSLYSSIEAGFQNFMCLDRVGIETANDEEIEHSFCSMWFDSQREELVRVDFGEEKISAEVLSNDNTLLKASVDAGLCMALR